MTFTEGTDEGQRCCIVKTDAATYYYQLDAGGFSSILDVSGVDWIDFHPGPGEVSGGAANVFRGTPNMVYPDGLGHPGSPGCRTTVHEAAPQIRSSSLDEAWAWEVTFTEHVARFSMTKTPSDRTYWFLYEGVPGGSYDPRRCFWGTPSGRNNTEACEPDQIVRSVPAPASEWTYFGHESAPRVFFCAWATKGVGDGVLYFMSSDGSGLDADDGMIVFGIGRGPGTQSQLHGPSQFLIGFIESVDHDEIRRRIVRLLE